MKKTHKIYCFNSDMSKKVYCFLKRKCEYISALL